MDSGSWGTVGSGQDVNTNHISTYTFDIMKLHVPKYDCRYMMNGSIVITEEYMLSYNQPRSQWKNSHLYGFHSMHYCISFQGSDRQIVYNTSSDCLF